MDTGALEKLIEQDIRGRALQPGDRYLTTRETARMLGVSSARASLALQALSKRQVLQRRRKSGTFVGHNVTDRHAPRLRCLHFVVRRDYLETEGLLADGVVLAIHDLLPGTEIQFNFVTRDDPVPRVRQMLDKVMASGADSIEGLVLIRTPRSVQQLVKERGLPAVVYGSAQPDLGLPWLDRDQEQIGRLLAGYMLEAKHQQFALFMRDYWGIGDNRLADGVKEALREAGLDLSHLAVRSLPPDEGLVQREVRLLLRDPERPTAFICRSAFLAESVARAAEEHGLAIAKDLAVGQCDYYRTPDSASRFPYARPVLDAREQGLILGRMLLACAEGRQPDPDHHVVPVEVVLPKDWSLAERPQEKGGRMRELALAGSKDPLSGSDLEEH